MALCVDVLRHTLDLLLRRAAPPSPGASLPGASDSAIDAYWLGRALVSVGEPQPAPRPATEFLIGHAGRQRSAALLRFVREDETLLWRGGCIRACQSAALRGDSGCLRFLLENGCPCDQYASAFSAGNGDIASLRCLVQNGVAPTHLAFLRAAERPEAATLEFLAETGARADGWALRAAASSADEDLSLRKLRILLLRRPGGGEPPWCPAPHCEHDAVAHAAARGHRRAIVLMRECGLPWSPRASLLAAMNGHAETLAYLQENGCPAHA